MRLVHPELTTQLDFCDGSFPSLVIENPSLFYRFVNDLYQQSCGNDGASVLSENNERISVAGNMELLTNFFPFEMNRKMLLGKVSAELIQQAQTPETYERSQQILSSVENLLTDLAFHADIELELPRLSIASLMKAAGVCLREEYLSLAEKITDYLELATRFKIARVFVLVNLRSILNDKEMTRLTDNCCRQDWRILLIDNHAAGKLPREIRTVVDADLCEI